MLFILNLELSKGVPFKPLIWTKILKDLQYISKHFVRRLRQAYCPNVAFGTTRRLVQ